MATPSPLMEERAPRVAWWMWKRFLLGGVLVVLLTAGATATAALLQVKEVATIISHGQKPLKGLTSVLDSVDSGGPQTILLLGSDRRYADIKAKNPARSDTIMLIRLDPGKPATTVLSVPRDLQVTIPGYGVDKINAAYSDGGPKLTVNVLKTLLGIPINHVVNVNFGGFRRAVDYLHCVYVDADRKYFNDNMGPGPDYATIDVKPGYQQLCGQNALDYVRYRHTDSDIERAARQQDFLRQAKDQIGVSGLLSNVNGLTRILARYTQTDVRSSRAILRLLKLAVLSAGHPVQQVHFPAILPTDKKDTFVRATPAAIQRTVHEFMHPVVQKAKPAKRGGHGARHRRRRTAPLPTDLVNAASVSAQQAAQLRHRVPFPVYVPRVLPPGARYSTFGSPRAYDLYDPGHHRHRAYRIVIDLAGIGVYGGVQGTNWTNPPILDHPSETRRVAHRSFEVFFDGGRIRMVAWHTPRAVYWISNDLMDTISNQDMLGLARSLTRAGHR